MKTPVNHDIMYLKGYAVGRRNTARDIRAVLKHYLDLELGRATHQIIVDIEHDIANTYELEEQ